MPLRYCDNQNALHQEDQILLLLTHHRLMFCDHKNAPDREHEILLLPMPHTLSTLHMLSRTIYTKEY